MSSTIPPLTDVELRADMTYPEKLAALQVVFRARQAWLDQQMRNRMREQRIRGLRAINDERLGLAGAL